MIGSEEMQAVGKNVFRAVAEAIGGPAVNDPEMQKMGEIAVKRYLSETDNDADAGQLLNFSGEMDGAVANLLRLRFVARGCAANDRGNPGVAKLQTIVAVNRPGFSGQAEFVENGVHKVSRAVAGEGAASAIGAVCAGCETKDENTGAGIAEAGDRTRPVGLVEVGFAPGFADALTVGAKARAELARNDGITNLRKGGRVIRFVRCRH